MKRLDGYVPPSATRVLLALIRVHQRALRAVGLVTWEPGLAGTLRPAVGPVQVMP